jgi:hypothetical protein
MYRYIDCHDKCMYVCVCVCVYICIHVSSEQMMRCVCMLYSRSNRNVTHHYRPICREEREKETSVLWEREDDDDIPRLCVSLAVFLFFFLFFWLVCRWKKVFLLPCRKFILLSLPIYAVNQSFRLSIHIRLSSFNVLFNVLRQA